MKLLIATPLYPPEIGGPATYAHTLERELPKRGIDVVVLPFASVRHLPKVFRHIAYFWKVLFALHGVDVLLMLDPVSVGFPAELAALIRGKRTVLKVVGDYAWEQGQQRFDVTATLDEFSRMPSRLFLTQVGVLRMVQSFVAEQAEHIIVPSKYLKGIVTSWGISPDKISVIYNAFDGVGELSTKLATRKELGISGHVLISAGRLVPWKGFRALIDVVRGLRVEYPDLTLFIAGSGPDDARLRSHIVNQNLAGVVVMLGGVSHDTLMKYIRSADCFVLNTGYEGLSHQLLEVLAVGTPIVTTSVGGNVELIEHGVTGLLVSHDDEEAILHAVTTLLGDHKKGATMVRNGKAFVEQFTTKRMVDETKAVFDSL